MTVDFSRREEAGAARRTTVPAPDCAVCGTGLGECARCAIAEETRAKRREDRP
jgi:hypothetical protein